MAKEEPMKEKRSKRKAVAAAANRGAAVVVAPRARAAVVASVAAFLESAGLPRRLAALQSEAGLEAAAWGSSQASTLGTVKVSNVSLEAAQRDIKEFFSFSGDIVHVEIQSGDQLSQVPYITFKDNQGAETAMLLTGATIVDMAVIVTPANDYELDFRED